MRFTRRAAWSSSPTRSTWASTIRSISPPYVNVSFGVTHPLGIGMLTLFETNAFNNQTALFSTINDAQPQPIVGGGFLLVAANPLPPRTIQVSYSINTGARKGAGYAQKGVRGGASLRAAQTPAHRRECGAERSARRPGLRRAALRAAARCGVRVEPRDEPHRMYGRTAAAREDRAGRTGRGRHGVRRRHDALARGEGRQRDAARRRERRLVLCARPEHPARIVPASARRRWGGRRAVPAPADRAAPVGEKAAGRFSGRKSRSRPTRRARRGPLSRPAQR